MSNFLRLEQITKVYRMHENLFLSGLGEMFEKAKSEWRLQDVLNPAKLQQTYKNIKTGLEAKADEIKQKGTFANQARYVKEMIFHFDELAVTALVHVNLQIEKGEFSAIAGPSGSGKTTLLNIIATLEEPSDGNVIFEGRTLGELDEDERAQFRLENLGFVFQAFNLIPVLSASENIEYPLILKGVPLSERRRRIEESLSFVGLSDLGHRRPNKLSGGQQQRVAIARALAVRPKLILADEPTANLDSKTAGLILDLMEKINRENGTTFIFSSHDPLVLSRARRVIALRDGEILEESRPSAALSRS